MKQEVFPFDAVIEALQKHYGADDAPALTKMAVKKRDPFLVLIACLLSLRTKDEVTDAAMSRLMKRAARPDELLRIRVDELEKIIYPVGFYRNKARILLDVSRTLLDQYGGRVPDTIEELLKLKGVGRKTANIVVTEGFNRPGIAVDTHVHRISNRLGAVHTRSPNETEEVLRDILPRQYWMSYNSLLVTHGRKICTPLSPFCGRCPVFACCKRTGVTRYRN